MMPPLPAILAVMMVAMSPAGDPVARAPGQRDWVSTYHGPRNDIPSAVVVSPDGTSVFVSGTSYIRARGNCSDYATAAYDASDGSQRWSARYDGPGASCDGVVGMALSDDGTQLIVTGTSPGIDSSDDIVTIAYDTADGSQTWLARYDGPFHGSDVSVGVVAASDANTAFVTGHVQLSECGDDLDPCEYEAVAIAYDAATGVQRWAADYGDPDGGSTGASAIASEGTMLFVSVVGRSGPSQLLALNASTGVRHWVADLDDTLYPGAIAVTPDGGTVVVTGENLDYNRYAITALATSDGSVRWRVNRGAPDFAWSSLAVAPEGDLFFAGESRSNYLVLQIDGGDGSTLWRARYRGSGGEDSPGALTTSLDGTRVYVTGSSARGGSYRLSYATIAFDATDGTVLWLDRYGGRLGGYHWALAIAATPTGDVVVTGESEGSDGWTDFATIKYLDA
jgi:hypothetical protein